MWRKLRKQRGGTKARKRCCWLPFPPSHLLLGPGTKDSSMVSQVWWRGGFVPRGVKGSRNVGQELQRTPAGRDLHLRAPPGAQHSPAGQTCSSSRASSGLCSPSTIFTVKHRWGHSLRCSESCPNMLLFVLSSTHLLTGSFLRCRKHAELSRPGCQHLTCAVLAGAGVFGPSPDTDTTPPVMTHKKSGLSPPLVAFCRLVGNLLTLPSGAGCSANWCTPDWDWAGIPVCRLFECCLVFTLSAKSYKCHCLRESNLRKASTLI